MHKQISIGLYVWGGLFLIPSTFLFIALHDQFWGVGGMLIGGAFLLGAIGRSIYCGAYNKQLDEREGTTLSSTCYKCNFAVTVQRSQFVKGRSYPEGYVKCPSCKIPLSYRTFVAEKSIENLKEYKNE